jgi:hypothetical protein
LFPFFFYNIVISNFLVVAPDSIFLFIFDFDNEQFSDTPFDSIFIF